MKNEFQIIMPVFQTAAIFKICIGSLLKTITYKTELIIINDCSPQEVSDIIEKYKSKAHNNLKIRLIVNETSLGYGKSVNHGINCINPEKYIVFADSDIIFNEGWQEKVIQRLSDNQIGGVGALLLYPQTGGIQNCGISYYNYLARHLFLNNTPAYVKQFGIYEVQASVFAFFATRGDIVANIGKMNDSYFNGYEDVDYQMRIREKGYKIIIDPSIEFYHWEKSNGAHRTYSRKQNLGRFWINNTHMIKDDLLDFISKNLPTYTQTDLAYIGVDLSETRRDAEGIWKYLFEIVQIEDIQDYTSRCTISNKIWLSELLSSDAYAIKKPFLFLCDNFIQLTENKYWFDLRKNYCIKDIIIDMYANVCWLSDLEGTFWPGNKIR